MTTEELLWIAAFEYTTKPNDDTYNYQEEWQMEQYYQEKELFEKLSQIFKPAI